MFATIFIRQLFFGETLKKSLNIFFLSNAFLFLFLVLYRETLNEMIYNDDEYQEVMLQEIKYILI